MRLASSTESGSRRPPLWLAAAAISTGLATLYASFVWISSFLAGPVHVDVRMYYVAAQAGLRYGWSTIYDQSVLRALSAGFPPNARFIDDQTTYASLPPLAWAFAPLTSFPEPAAFALWTVVSLGALVLAWHLCAPYSGLSKWTLLTLALGLWPVALAFDLGQPTMVVMGLVAVAFWFSTKGRPLQAGVMLALATFLKPQAVLLLPVALLVAGQIRMVVAWVAGCILLGGVSVASLGSSGVTEWWHTARTVESLPVNTEYTLAHIVGGGPTAYVLWMAQGAAALYVARQRRHQLEIVFAAGLVGSVATAWYFHAPDYTVLLLPAWLMLRTSPPVWQRLYLLAGVVPMQLMTYWADPHDVIWTLVTRGSQLAWDAGWLAILVVSCVTAQGGLRHREIARADAHAL